MDLSSLASLLGRRLQQLVWVVFGIATLVFFLTRLSGDPATALVGTDATQEQIEVVRDQLGLNDPLAVQYGRFLMRLVVLDFGISYQFRQPAIEIVLQRLPYSIYLAGSAILIAVGVGVPLGIAVATGRNKWYARPIAAFSVLAQSAPSFVVGIILILFFSVRWGIFPTGGATTLGSIVLPAITLSSFMLARQLRLVQAYAWEEMASQYVRTARSLGYSNFRIHYRHILRNVLVPLVSLLGIEFGLFVGGAVITEAVFAWPGLGRLMVTAVTARDYPLIQAGVFMVSVTVVTVNFIVDLLYQVIDPRMRSRS